MGNEPVTSIRITHPSDTKDIEKRVLKLETRFKELPHKINSKEGTILLKSKTKIPPTRFELVSPDPKSCMIDRYTTGVCGSNIVNGEY